MGEQDHSDVDAQFAEIIAHWSDDALAPPGAAPWPDLEGLPPAEAGTTTPEPGTAPPESGPDPEAPGEQDSGEGPPAASPRPPAPPVPPAPPGLRASPTVPPDAPGRSPDTPPSWGPPAERSHGGQPVPDGRADRDGDGEHPGRHRSPGVDDDPEEHFHPGPTQPLPVGDLQFWGIVIGLTAGPLLLLWIVMFDRGASSLLLLAALGLTVGGFAMLVSRLPGRRDDDGDDDGARL